MILHIPHSSILIPDDLREQIVLSDDDLTTELRLMTDWYTDELYTKAGATVVRFPLSRLLVDVERFDDDSQEPMSEKGMGKFYQSRANGDALRRTLEPQERATLQTCYNLHHESLREAVASELEQYGQARIIDCHSFPNTPLPCNTDQSVPRPDICIGTDGHHTPAVLSELATRTMSEFGYTCTHVCLLKQ
jgi:N-formylglutamate deformylase